MNQKHWACKFHICLFLCAFSAISTQPILAQSEQLEKIGSFRVSLESRQERPKDLPLLRLVPIQTHPDQEISFVSPDRVRCVYDRPQDSYIKTEEMLKKLQQEQRKNFLRIHLEKPFYGWNNSEKERLGERKVIEFAKSTGYRRCLILIDNAQTSDLKLTEILDGIEAPSDNK